MLGKGDEAILPMGRNVGRNQNTKRGDEIAELRRQVVSLAEVLQFMQPPHEATNSHSHFENLFGVSPRGRPYVERNKPRLDYNFKIETWFSEDVWIVELLRRSQSSIVFQFLDWMTC